MPKDIVNTVDEDQLRNSIWHHLTYFLGKDERHARLYDWRMSLSLALRDLVVAPWFESTPYGVLAIPVFTRRRGIEDSIEATPFTLVSRPTRNCSNSLRPVVAILSR